jgi:hypothetical protein
MPRTLAWWALVSLVSCDLSQAPVSYTPRGSADSLSRAADYPLVAGLIMAKTT